MSDDGRLLTVTALGLLTLVAAARGSRAIAQPAIVVVRVEPHKVGFKPGPMSTAMARGKTFDPNAIGHVDVTLGSDDPDALRTEAVFELARKAAHPFIFHGWPRIVSQVYPNPYGPNPRGPSPAYIVRVEVSS